MKKARTIGISYGKGTCPTLIMDKKIVGEVKRVIIDFDEEPPKISIISVEEIEDFKGKVDFFLLFDGNAVIK